MLLFGRGQSADAGADEDANLVAIHFVEVQAGVLDRLVGRVNPELREAVGAPDFLGGRKGGGGIKILDLGGDLAIELRNVERGDRADAAPAPNQVVPECVHVVAQRGNHAQARHNHPPLFEISAHETSRGSSR